MTLLILEMKLIPVNRPVRDHDALLIGKCTVDLLRNERHVGMQQLQCRNQHGAQRVERSSLGLIRIIPEPRLHHLDIPVTELLPEEAVDLIGSDTQLILLHILGNIPYKGVALTEDPAVCQRQVGQLHGIDGCRIRLVDIHQDETGCVPYLVCEITVGDDTLPVEAHVVARRISGDQRETQGVGTVLIDDLKRIDPVPQRLTHLPALVIANQTMEQNRVERQFSGLLDG